MSRYPRVFSVRNLIIPEAAIFSKRLKCYVYILIFSFYRLDILYTFGSFLNQDRLYQHSSFWPQNGYTNRAFPSDGRVF